MEVRPRETVILAADFDALVRWYQEALGFAVTQRIEDGFHYCHMQTDSGIRIGIAAAQEMGVKSVDRANNSVVLQLEVDDLREFFTQVQQRGAAITGGPNFNQADSFWFGAIADPEGNPIWVVDQNCP
ncbi:MAG: VOC family protein [Planctomycetota bacterium]